MAETYVEKIRRAQRAEGPATILAIGTTTPPNFVSQADYPDYYFCITNSEHMTDLKQKFKRMCDKSMIKKRYMYLTEKNIEGESKHVCVHGSFCGRAPRHGSCVGAEVGERSRYKGHQRMGSAEIQNYPPCFLHYFRCRHARCRLPTHQTAWTETHREEVYVYQQGCFAGGTVLRLAKDLAENNKGARVLVVCSEITAVTFRGPSDTHLDSLVGQALFGDGAAAIIVGADPDTKIERPVFQLVSAAQTILPDSDGAIDGHLREVGLTFHLLKDVPGLISKNIEKSLVEAFSPICIKDWNSIFWIAHPGGPAILDQVEAKLGLKEDKLRATHHVLSEFGNMSSACVLFILDEMRKKFVEEGKGSTGEGLEWGVLLGFGPGLTVETVVLHSIPTHATH